MIHWHTSGKMLSWWSTSNMRMFMIHTHNMHINKYRISMNFIYIYNSNNSASNTCVDIWGCSLAPTMTYVVTSQWGCYDFIRSSLPKYINIKISVDFTLDWLFAGVHSPWLSRIELAASIFPCFWLKSLDWLQQKMRPILGWKLINWPLDHSPSTQQIHIRRTTCYLHSWN